MPKVQQQISNTKSRVISYGKLKNGATMIKMSVSWQFFFKPLNKFISGFRHNVTLLNITLLNWDLILRSKLCYLSIQKAIKFKKSKITFTQLQNYTITKPTYLIFSTCFVCCFGRSLWYFSNRRTNNGIM